MILNHLQKLIALFKSKPKLTTLKITALIEAEAKQIESLLADIERETWNEVQKNIEANLAQTRQNLFEDLLDSTPWRTPSNKFGTYKEVEIFRLPFESKN